MVVKFLGNGERTKDKMYDGISATTACYRRLNATHQVGCSCKHVMPISVIDLSNSFYFSTTWWINWNYSLL